MPSSLAPCATLISLHRAAHPEQPGRASRARASLARRIEARRRSRAGNLRYRRLRSPLTLAPIRAPRALAPQAPAPAPTAHPAVASPEPSGHGKRTPLIAPADMLASRSPATMSKSRELPPFSPLACPGRGRRATRHRFVNARHSPAVRKSGGSLSFLTATVAESKSLVTARAQTRKRFAIRNKKRFSNFTAANTQCELRQLPPVKAEARALLRLPSPPQFRCDKLVPKFSDGFESAVALVARVAPASLRQERES
jgi:hypothetical protein